ncbi:MAG: hypothetical protein Kow006_08140 [Gammaproteobacteria bacterium]
MGREIDFYFVTISPWSYLGMDRLREMAPRYGATIVYKPVDLPRIFETIGYQPINQRPKALLVNRMNELLRWKSFLHSDINVEPRFFPVNPGLSHGVILAAQLSGEPVGELTLALMRGCWVEERDISDRDTVASIAASVGLDGHALLESATDDAVKARLAANTEEAIGHYAMGVPTYVVDGEAFFGQDRLPFVERKLSGLEPRPAYLVGQIRVKDPQAWQRYVAGVAESLRPYPAQVLFRGRRRAVLAGENDSDQAVVIRFRDQETLQRWFESPDYQALIPLRDSAADVTILSYAPDSQGSISSPL